MTPEEVLEEMGRRQSGAPPLAGRDRQAQTAFHWACEWGHTAVVTALMDAGVYLEAGRNTPHGTGLMAAAKEGAAGVVEALIKGGAQVDARGGDDGCTAFHFACAAGNTHCVELLVGAGCDTELGTARGNYTGSQMVHTPSHPHRSLIPRDVSDRLSVGFRPSSCSTLACSRCLKTQRMQRRYWRMKPRRPPQRLRPRKSRTRCARAAAGRSTRSAAR